MSKRDYLKLLTKEQLIQLVIRESERNYVPELKNVEDSINEAKKLIENWEQENFIAMFVDRNLKLIHKEMMFKGGISSTIVDMNILFRKLLSFKNVSGLITAHNHPSWALYPSEDDKKVQKRIQEICDLFGINYCDNLIITELSSVSVMHQYA